MAAAAAAAAVAAAEPMEGFWPSGSEAEESGCSSCDGEEEEEEEGSEGSEEESEAWLEEQQGCTPLRTPQQGYAPRGWRGGLAEGEEEEEGEEESASEEEDYDGEEDDDGVEGCGVEGCGSGFEAALPPEESTTPLRLHESPSIIGLLPTHDALFDDADDFDGGAGRLKVELSRRLDEMVVAMDTGSPPAVTDRQVIDRRLPSDGCPASRSARRTRRTKASSTGSLPSAPQRAPAPRRSRHQRRRSEKRVRVVSDTAMVVDPLR